MARSNTRTTSSPSYPIIHGVVRSPRSFAITSAADPSWKWKRWWEENKDKKKKKEEEEDIRMEDKALVVNGSLFITAWRVLVWRLNFLKQCSQQPPKKNTHGDEYHASEYSDNFPDPHVCHNHPLTGINSAQRFKRREYHTFHVSTGLNCQTKLAMNEVVYFKKYYAGSINFYILVLT